MSKKFECNSGNKALDQKIKEWVLWDENETTKAEILEMVEDKRFDELKKIMLTRIDFGTAGLRGKMAAGYFCMNDLIIIQTAQGILKYLEENVLGLLQKFGIVVGFDGRYNSERWAKVTAAIFIHAGYSVRLFSEVNPTPFIPFAVTLFSCAMGIMVTASHNPKEDNGYKVYAANGAQIVSPVDKEIQACILKCLEPLSTSWDLSVIKYGKNKLSDPLQKTLLEYLNNIAAIITPQQKEMNRRMGLLFTYTAMHGVGYKFIFKAFDLINLHMEPVAEQRDPHPDFPTVRFPNPEEGKSALELAFRVAEEKKSFIVIANDPDADRMCVAEKNKRTGRWYILNGNETGALLGWWLLHCYKEKYHKGDLKNVYMLSSTVSSKILETMAKKEGFNFEETLTGFKWLGNKADELNKKGKKVIFAFEEAIGFMCGSSVLDKDGISAGYQIATLASYLYNDNNTIMGKLNEIYNTYGQHVTKNSYYICEDPSKMVAIFNSIRRFENNSYPTKICEGKYPIQYIRDLTTGYDSSSPDLKPILPVSSSTQMITFTFNNGFVCTIRGSGTEPKLKYYSELRAPPEETDRDKIFLLLNEMVGGIIKDFIRPEANGLIAQMEN